LGGDLSLRDAVNQNHFLVPWTLRRLAVSGERESGCKKEASQPANAPEKYHPTRHAPVSKTRSDPQMFPAALCWATFFSRRKQDLSEVFDASTERRRRQQATRQ
jgi:hypothetical protein